jgi:divinyl protochlorophyllide a 8-vinyl-reductase
MATVEAALGGTGSPRQAADAVRALIGPNAVTQVAAALQAAYGAQHTAWLFTLAGIAHHLAAPPAQMIDEADVQRLHQVLRDQLGVPAARRIGAAAGRATGDYLLAHRIPRLAQWLLKRMPAAWAAHMLVAAIRRHAWTFAGAGAFSAQAGEPLRLTIRNGPIGRGAAAGEPVCDFYVHTFLRLFGELVHPQAQVEEVECQATGDAACVFELRW